MEKEFFRHKSHCELCITSSEVDLQIINNEMKIPSDRSFKKGEEFKSKSSGTTGKRHTNLWAISSKSIISPYDNDIASHITYMKNIISSENIGLQNLKKNKDIHIGLSIWIESESKSIRFEIENEDIVYVKSICNTLTFTFIADEEIEEIKE